MSDEGGKTEKMEANEERSVHGGMKGADCVSLCCTKQSQATQPSHHPSMWKT